jgi:hypothetical protein
MPYLSIVHLRDLVCATCRAPLAVAGARSFIVDDAGEPIRFADDDAPAEMEVEIVCPNRHVTTLLVPNEIAAEETLRTPEASPLGSDAILRDGTTESGRPLVRAINVAERAEDERRDT